MKLPSPRDRLSGVADTGPGAPLAQAAGARAGAGAGEAWAWLLRAAEAGEPAVLSLSTKAAGDLSGQGRALQVMYCDPW